MHAAPNRTPLTAAAAQARPQVTHPPGEIITNRTDIQTDKATIAATWRQVFLLLTPLYKNKKSRHSTNTEKQIVSPENLACSVHQTDISNELNTIEAENLGYTFPGLDGQFV